MKSKICRFGALVIEICLEQLGYLDQLEIPLSRLIRVLYQNLNFLYQNVRIPLYKLEGVFMKKLLFVVTALMLMASVHAAPILAKGRKGPKLPEVPNYCEEYELSTGEIVIICPI